MADAPNGNNQTGWMSDVQRAIALILIGSFAVITIISSAVLVIVADKVLLADMAKTLQAAMVNMSLIALGFFFGSTLAKTLSDAGTQKVVEKLTGAPSPPGPGGPVAPVPQPVVVVAWWSLLTDAEKAAITEAAKTDAKIQALIAIFAAGKAEPEHLAALVTAGLLTKERAETFKTA
jgi:hypothetical protein